MALLLQYTRIGKATRAVSDNPDLASSSGIDVDRVILYVWIGGGALAAMGGILFAVSERVQFDMGFRMLLLMFAGITLGGLGTAYGALGRLVRGRPGHPALDAGHLHRAQERRAPCSCSPSF